MDPRYALCIRIANQDDASVLAEIGRRTFAESFAALNRPEDMESYLKATFNGERVREELTDCLSTFFIAELGEEVVGYAKLHAGEPPHSITRQRPVQLSRLYVCAPQIGQGIGASLMRTCIEHAKAAGHDTLWLGVWEHNHRAQAFYHQWTFRVVGSYIFRLGSDDQTDILMELSLSEDGSRSISR